jgi:pimeloyl-ACP methyl ester carboxylesterase
MPSVETEDLSLHFETSGEPTGTAVLLLHGWPDDASTWDRVAPALVQAGCRVIVPSLRGFGQSVFRTADGPRTGNSAIHAMDMVALLDALGVEKAIAIGHDWGSNIVEALAVGWSARIERMAMLATPPRLGGMPTPPFHQAQLYWYHWFMATERGAEAVRADREGFARIHWENWAPRGWFNEATFARVARSWDNPDWVDVTLHSYRSRWDNAAPDGRSVWLEERIKATETLSLPTLFIKGDVDGVTAQDSFSRIPPKFSGPFELIGLPGVGHFPQREAPEAVAALLLEFVTGRRP